MRKDYRDLALFGDDGFDLFSPFDWFNAPIIKKEDKNFSRFLKTDIKENENEYELEMEMPGIDKKDISLELKDGYLNVGYQKQTSCDEKDKKGNYIRKERCYGSSSRSFFVGKEIKEEDVYASLKDGILSIKLPKKSPQIEQSKKIEIK